MRRIELLCCLLAAGIWLGSAAPGQAAEPSVKTGEELAIKYCARCHVVGDKNKYGGIDSTPSFHLMAKYPDLFMGRLQSFYVRRPHPGQKLKLKDEQIDHVIAYVRSLTPKKQ